MSTPISEATQTWTQWQFLGLFCVELGILAGVRALGPLPAHLPAFAFLFTACLGVYALQIYRIPRGGYPDLSLGTLLLMGALLRLTLVGTPPDLSGDVYRYLFEGAVTLAGGNPYLTAPADPALAAVAPGLLPLVNHPAIPTVYPPLAQLIFAGVRAVAPSVSAMQLTVVAFDLITLGALWSCLRALGRPPAFALVYALHPLPCLELGQSAHMDSLAIAPMALGLAALLHRRPLAAALLFGASAATKLIGGVGLLLVGLGGPRLRPGLVLAGAALLPLSYLYFWAPGLLSGLETYARHWSFNQSGFALLEATLPPGVSRWAAAAIFLAVALTLARRRDPATFALGVTATFFFLSPTAHPWYYLWVLPWVCLRFSWSLSLFGGLVVLSYHALTTLDPLTGAWSPAPWVQVVEYGGLLAMALMEWGPWRGGDRGDGVREGSGGSAPQVPEIS